VRKLRVVADTNILLSSVFWSGNPYKIIQKGIDQEILIFISQSILDELQRILSRDFNLEEQEIKDIIDAIMLFTHFVKPQEKINAVKADEKDNIILECAVAAEADYIVSGDHHLKDLIEFRGIKIVTAARLLELLEP
jgi:uncharacterized protein